MPTVAPSSMWNTPPVPSLKTFAPPNTVWMNVA